VILESLAGYISRDLQINGSSQEISGISRGARAAIYAALYKKFNKPIYVISEDARELADDIALYIDNTHYFPSWDTFPTEDISPSKEIVGERLNVLHKVLDNKASVVLSKVKAAISWTIPADALREHSLHISKSSGQIKMDELILRLVQIGFKRQDIVGERGEFSARGGIIDIFPVNMEHPIRIEFIGNDIESIRTFDANNQRSVKFIEEADIFPLHEVIPKDPSDYKDGIELKIPEISKDFHTIFEHLGKDTIIILDSRENLKLSSERYINEIEELRAHANGKYYITFEEMLSILSGKTVLESSPNPGNIHFDCSPLPDFMGKLEDVFSWVSNRISSSTIFIVSKQADRLHELAIEKGLSPLKIERAPKELIPGLYAIHSELGEGFSCGKYTVLTDKEIFGIRKERLTFKVKPSEGISKEMLAELKLGEYVVHTNYGIGIYQGLKKMEIGNAVQEYIQINYAEEDILYVPLHQMGLVEKYAGGGEYKPKIGRLGGKDWQKTVSKAKSSIKDIAAELMDIYKKRNIEKGYMYPPDQAWQIEFEKAFPYEETPDQEKAIRELKGEMESGKLVDRLVCGDVGYGKTEVALRIAFKTIASGKQVAVLTPTTVLADQHFRTFSQRMKPYPISVDLLSRFRSKEEQKETIKNISVGAVELVVGTHRLLQKDIKFKDLGLIIIDEEQKFGVTHKERLKALASGVNIITLSATPIPRTLYMALSGIKEMSLITTPPLDRSPVRTYLREWNENTIKEVLLRELERGGQVFFVHNYVKTIDKVAALIKELIPSARIAVGHGQMDEMELESVMIKFINKEYDVLVSTSIIESGLDIPSVNTVIIDHAENFGLSQLYQIRGRVGRSSTRAFAYLLYHKEKVLTEQALERLKAIQEFTALGSGYKLAMADLEIRGTGNILGAQQSGHMLNIGFDMYCDLLEDSVNELKNIIEPQAKKVLIDLKIDAFIPETYVPDEKQRIALYKRLNFLNSLTELDELKIELKDRFGKVPEEVLTLLKIIKIKILASGKMIASIVGGKDLVSIRNQTGKILKLETGKLSGEKWFKYIEETIKNTR
jgi:transcription-repair coupling factor (superfamily II helicase)